MSFGSGSCNFTEIISTFNYAHSGCKLNFSSFSLLSWTTDLTTAVLLQETFAPLNTGRYFYLQGVKEVAVSPAHSPCFIGSQRFSKWNTATYGRQRGAAGPGSGTPVASTLSRGTGRRWQPKAEEDGGTEGLPRCRRHRHHGEAYTERLAAHRQRLRTLPQLETSPACLLSTNKVPSPALRRKGERPGRDGASQTAPRRLRLASASAARFGRDGWMGRCLETG